MSQVMKVSKEGYDVMGTAGTVPNNLNYSSEYNTLKYYTAGSAVVSGSAVFPFTANYYGTINHNLGYYPYFSCFINDGADTSIYYNNGYILVGAGGFVRYATAFASTANLIFLLSLQNGASGTLSGTATFYYKIFKNNLNL